VAVDPLIVENRPGTPRATWSICDRRLQMPAPRFVGSEVKRLEDPRLLRGQAQFLDDLTLHGLAHAYVVRSPHAHARIARLDVTRAARHAGVAWPSPVQPVRLTAR